jgi:hypothetical protein
VTSGSPGEDFSAMIRWQAEAGKIPRKISRKIPRKIPRKIARIGRTTALERPRFAISGLGRRW